MIPFFARKINSLIDYCSVLRSAFIAFINSKIFEKCFLTLTLVVRVSFYNEVAAVRNRDADFKK